MSVTIAIPFYNAEKYLAQTINSVFAQTHSDWELLLIDDGSSDQSLDIAMGYKDDRVRVISDGENKGLAARLNQVVLEAKYEFIARMDADDLMCPERISRQVSFLNEHKNLDIVTTGVCSLDEDDNIIGVRVVQENHVIQNIEQVYLGGHGIVHASILARKNWYKRNRYSETLKRAQDFDLWLRAYSKNDLNVGYLPYADYYYREGFSVDKQKLLNGYKAGYEIIELNKESLDNVFIKKLTLRIKTIIVTCFFDFGLNKYLLRRRFKDKIDESYTLKLKRDINIIDSVSKSQ